MEMTSERLQEIKRLVAKLEAIKPTTYSGVLLELIAAHEAAQAELTDLQLRYDNQRDDCIDYVKDIADLRKQLVDVVGRKTIAIKMGWKWRIQRNKLRKQLAASQAEVERLHSALSIKENGCPLCGEGEVQYLIEERDIWCSTCESNYAGMMIEDI